MCRPFNRCLDSLSACLSGYERKLCVTSIDCYFRKEGKGTEKKGNRMNDQSFVINIKLNGFHPRQGDEAFPMPESFKVPFRSNRKSFSLDQIKLLTRAMKLTKALTTFSLS